MFSLQGFISLLTPCPNPKAIKLFSFAYPGLQCKVKKYEFSFFFLASPVYHHVASTVTIIFNQLRVCPMQILVSHNIPVWYHRYLTYTSAHYWEQMTQWTKLRNFLGTCAIYYPSICSVILLYAWPEAVVGILKVVYFYVNIPFSWLQYEACTKEKIGSHGKFGISYYCIQWICCKCLWGFNLFERTNIRGLRGDGFHINIAMVLEFGSVYK